jgi:hypothetical protein
MYRNSTLNMKYNLVNGVGVPQSVQQLTTEWLPGVQFSAGARDFSLSHSVQTALWPTQPYIQGLFASG